MSSSQIRPTRLHVGNLPFQANIRVVEEFLHGFGPIKHILLKKGFAFVEFIDGQNAENAMRELNGRMLYGRNVTLEYAEIQSQWHVNPRRYSPQSPIRRSRSPQMRSRSPSPAPSRRRELSPRAAAWYQGMRPSREVVRENLRLAHEERHLHQHRRSSRRRSRSREASRSTVYSREDRERRISPRHRSPSRSRSRSLHVYNSHHHRRYSRSRTPSQSSSARKRELPTIDLEVGDLDEYEEVEEPFFKLLDHRPELEEIAGQLSLDINIRPFDVGNKQQNTDEEVDELQQLHQDEKGMEMGRKRHRRNNNTETKLEAIEWAREYSIHSASKKFGVDRKSIREWTKQEQRLKEQLNTSGGANRKRLDGGGRPVTHQQHDKQLADWIDIEMRQNKKQPVSRNLIRSQRFQTDGSKSSFDAMILCRDGKKLTRATWMEEPFFKLLDHRPELEEIAGQLALDINIRPFDGSVAFGGIVNQSAKNNKVKQEPSTSSNCAPIEPVEKWMVFADRGPTVHVSSYERNTLVREHIVPKFEWEPFSGAIRGMCEKFLMGK